MTACVSSSSRRHLISIDDVSVEDVHRIFALAEPYIARNRALDKKHPILKGRTVVNLFFENSTRTRTSFELAGKRLGADVINLSAAASSVKKGESLIDTAMTVAAMRPDVIVVRHAESGAADLVAGVVGCSVVNAGDGCHEHPTQALLDAITIQRRKGRIEGLTVAICGDILHSRVARSNIKLLTRLGARVRLVAPPTLMPAFPETWNVERFFDLRQGIEGCDIVMMLRLQLERMGSGFVPSAREFFHRWGLDAEKMTCAKPGAFVMHPGPMNRGVEIDGGLADNLERSLILDQVEMGVAVRQAVLEWLA